jgi:hypothetical protein
MNEPIINRTPEELQTITDNCIYASYKWNRIQFPHWTVDQWTKIFGYDAYLMELRYQGDL